MWAKVIFGEVNKDGKLSKVTATLQQPTLTDDLAAQSYQNPKLSIV